MIRLLVGLGNPGPEYEMTRHNAGFWFVDEVAKKLGVSLVPERSYFGLAGRVNRPAGPVWLLKPMTFMNLSGKSVAALSRYFKITPEETLVVHDELDLAPGQIKLKRGGSHAGHNGLKDIQAQLGSADYWRLRLGIGHPGVKAEVVNYVLRKPPGSERDAIDANMAQALSALDLLLEGAMDQALMKLHAKPPRPKLAKPFDQRQQVQPRPQPPVPLLSPPVPLPLPLPLLPQPTTPPTEPQQSPRGDALPQQGKPE